MVFDAMLRSTVRRIAAMCLLISSPWAFAAANVETLSVSFDYLDQSVPLSDWLTAGIALSLAVAATIALRRRGAPGGRLLGLLLAVAVGTVLVSATGQRLISEARAGFDGGIELTANPGSPATLDVAPYFLSFPSLAIGVTNLTGRTVVITGIALPQPAIPYMFDPNPQGPHCVQGQVLESKGQCIVYLVGADT